MFPYPPPDPLTLAIERPPPTHFAVQLRRERAASTIQRAFRAWSAQRETLVYLHVKCPATTDDDQLYRLALADALRIANVRLKWIEIPNIRFGYNSRFNKIARGHAGQHTFLVVGSHGCPPFLPPLEFSDSWRRLLGATGFFIIENQRVEEGSRVMPTPAFATRVMEAWPLARLFIDACYSTVNIDDGEIGGHDDNPRYSDAIDRIVVWIETLILTESASVLLL